MQVIILGPIHTKTYFGGTATVVEEIALAFARRGDKVIIATLYGPGERQLPGVHVFTPSWTSCTPLDVFLRSVQLVMFLRKHPCDLLISNLYYSVFINAAKALKKIHILHGAGYWANGWVQAKIGNWSNILGFKMADVTIANSYLTFAINYSMFGIHSIVIPWGVSSAVRQTPILPESERDIDVLYVGRLTKNKYILLVKAIKLLKPRVKLHIVGSGPDMGRLSTLVKDLDIMDCVVFHGYHTGNNLYKYYARARCFASIHPAEPFGLVYLEALANGTPVVLSKSSGFAGFCDDRFACLVDNDPESVALGIEEALRRHWDREWISEYALRNFSWDRTVQRIVETVL